MIVQIDLKIRKSVMINDFKQSFIYRMHDLHPSFDFDASNSAKLHCFETTLNKQCDLISLFILK